MRQTAKDKEMWVMVASIGRILCLRIVHVAVVALRDDDIHMSSYSRPPDLSLNQFQCDDTARVEATYE